MARSCVHRLKHRIDMFRLVREFDFHWTRRCTNLAMAMASCRSGHHCEIAGAEPSKLELVDLQSIDPSIVISCAMPVEIISRTCIISPRNTALPARSRAASGGCSAVSAPAGAWPENLGRVSPQIGAGATLARRPRK